MNYQSNPNGRNAIKPKTAAEVCKEIKRLPVLEAVRLVKQITETVASLGGKWTVDSHFAREFRDSYHPATDEIVKNWQYNQFVNPLVVKRLEKLGYEITFVQASIPFRVYEKEVRITEVPTWFGLFSKKVSEEIIHKTTHEAEITRVTISACCGEDHEE